MGMERQLSHAQNFLKNRKLVTRLIARANITTSDTVIEIGPGRGIITEQLAAQAKQVIAVELDHTLARRLQEKFSDRPHVGIIEADFLSCKLPAVSYKVFANIPFDRTADILHRLLDGPNPPHAAHLIMQDTAAAKYIARPHGPNTQSAILLYPFFDVHVEAKINRHNFWPTPHVDAVLAAFTQRPQPSVERADRPLFRDFVIYGFNQWAPTLAAAVAKVLPARQLAEAETTYLRQLRPSEVPPDLWLRLFATFAVSATTRQLQLVRGAEERHAEQHRAAVKLHRTRS